LGKKILIYEGACPKCRLLSNLAKIFDVRGKLTYLPIRTKEATELLHGFYEKIPYNFHFIDDDKDICYTGLKSIPVIFYEIIIGLFWPFGGKGPLWLSQWRAKRVQSH